MIVPESGTTKRTHLAPLYHPDTLVNPDTYIGFILCQNKHIQSQRVNLAKMSANFDNFFGQNLLGHLVFEDASYMHTIRERDIPQCDNVWICT